MGTKDAALSRSANAKLQGNEEAGVERQSLTQQVAAWHKSYLPQAPQVAESDRGAALHQKFAAAKDSFTFTYGSIAEFFEGLEGMVGSPSADVMKAMEQEHASDETFEAWNAEILRITTPRAEWSYVVEVRAGDAVLDPAAAAAAAKEDGRGRVPSHAADQTGRTGWKLDDFAKQPEVQQAGLMLPEVAGIRLYTGPMYKLYNLTLRDRKKGSFVTTLHAINSGIVKLSRQTKATTVYRGASGGVLPQQFWQPNEHGVIGGVELGFMSTSTQRDVALGYMKQSSKTSQILFEIRMGMIDRGADVSCLSQFPAEKEILFAPLTGLEVAAVPRDELGVLIVELRLSCNLHDQTLEEVVGKMRTSHLSLVDKMMDDLRLGLPVLPPAVLQPLRDARERAAGFDHEYFNEPNNYLLATKEAFGAKDACFQVLASEETWADQAKAEPAKSLAKAMRTAAEKCAKASHPAEAASLLVMAAGRGGVPPEHEEKVAEAEQGLGVDTAAQRCALEAASLLLDQHRSGGLWAATLLELGSRGGDRPTVTSLARLHGFPGSALCATEPLAAFPDLPFDRYRVQPHFHQINTSYPGLQLIHEEPYIFVAQDFVSAAECSELILHLSKHSDLQASATSKRQEERRTSTQVLMQAQEFPWLRQRLVKLCNVSEQQLEPAKLTHYAKGQFFRKHTDSVPHPKKKEWWAKLKDAVANGGLTDVARAELLQVEAKQRIPNRFCTAFLYLNDVAEGGLTTFSQLQHPFYQDLGAVDQLHCRPIPNLPPRDPQSKSNSKPALSIAPHAGMLVLHFPSTLPEYACLMDPGAAHESEDAVLPKYIVQQFIWSDPKWPREVLGGQNVNVTVPA